jgi:hypothetical protein
MQTLRDPDCSPAQFIKEAQEREWSRLYGKRVEAWVQLFPAWDPNLRDWDEIGQATVGTTDVFVPVLEYRVPKGYVGWCFFFGQDAAISTAFQETVWRITVNGGVYAKYPALVQVGSMIAPTPVNIPINQGNVIRVEVTMSGGTPRVLTARLKGLQRPWMGEQQ